MKEHNKLRAKHIDTPPMSLVDEISISAQKWANNAKFEHSTSDQRNGWGENLAWNMAKDERSAAKMAVKQWYSEIRDFNFEQPEFQSSTGHFTQVLKF